VLFADALGSVEDIAHFAAKAVKPVCVNMGFGLRTRRTTPLLTPRELEELGVALMIAPRLLTAAAAEAMRGALALLGQVIETGQVVDRPDLLMSFEDLHELTGIEDIRDLERRFLVGERPAA
jgi:2-methylisocitrate lyase-like PEP mutase family enzyme